ncbi:MAG: addiction module antidote protein, HigA family [Candidatus Meridianibacter frigidus]|nr:MAG: addiction module antidote protein, HigA family [Candidatus Eremiobacteraeota bacterium]
MKRPIHPGEVLKEDVLNPLGLSANKLAAALDIPTNRLTEIIGGRRAVSADTALRLARYLGTTPQFWLALQSDYDLDTARAAEKEILSKVRPRRKKLLVVA